MADDDVDCPGFTAETGARIRTRVEVFVGRWSYSWRTFWIGWTGNPGSDLGLEVYWNPVYFQKTGGTRIYKVRMTSCDNSVVTATPAFVGRKEFRDRYGPDTEYWRKLEAILLAATINCQV